MAATLEGGELRAQPVFSLMHAAVVESLVRFVAGGQRKIDAWTAGQRTVLVPFDDAAAFANANTLAELLQLDHQLQHGGA